MKDEYGDIVTCFNHLLAVPESQYRRDILHQRLSSYLCLVTERFSLSVAMIFFKRVRRPHGCLPAHAGSPKGKRLEPFDSREEEETNHHLLPAPGLIL